MRMTQRTIRGLAVVTVAALLAAACGNGGEDTTTGDAAEGPASGADATGSQPASGELDRDAILRVQQTKSHTELDPDTWVTGTPTRHAAYDFLIEANSATAELIPGMAEDWEFLDDGATLRLYLRKGVVFHDGAPFNAEAVEINFARSRVMGDVGRSESTKAVNVIDSTTIVDEHTIDLHRIPGDRVGWSVIESLLAGPAGAMISPKAIADGVNLDRNPVGAGAFKFDSIRADRTVYTRFDGYWDPDAALVGGVEFLFPTSPDTHVNALISRETHLTDLDLTLLFQVENQAGITTVAGESLYTYKLAVNHSMPPMDDINVRKALLYGIDRQELLDLTFDGLGSPTEQSFPKSYFAYNDEYTYEYDPEYARGLLEASKYWTADGIKTKIYLLPQPAVRVRMAEVIQDQLGRIGLHLDITPAEEARQNLFTAKESPNTMMLHARSRVDPLQHLVQSLHDEFGPTNPGGFTTPEIADLMDRAAVANPVQRRELVREISGKSTEGVYGSVGLFAANEAWAYNDCVTGFEIPLLVLQNVYGIGILADCL